MKGRRYRLWWSGERDGICCFGVMVKEELCEKVVEVRRVCDRVMTVVFEEDVLRLICGYAPHSGRSLEEKQPFYNSFNVSGICISAVDLVMCLGDFNGHVGWHIDISAFLLVCILFDCDLSQFVCKVEIKFKEILLGYLLMVALNVFEEDYLT